MRCPQCNGEVPLFRLRNARQCPHCGIRVKAVVRNLKRFRIFLAIFAIAALAIGILGTRGVISALYVHVSLLLVSLAVIIAGLWALANFELRAEGGVRYKR